MIRWNKVSTHTFGLHEIVCIWQRWIRPEWRCRCCRILQHRHHHRYVLALHSILQTRSRWAALRHAAPTLLRPLLQANRKQKNMRKIYCVPMPMHTHDTFKTNINVSNRMSFAHWRYCLHSICAAKEMLLDNCIFIDVFCLYTIRSLLAILQFCVWPKRIIMTWSQSEPNSHTNIHTIHSYRSPIGTYKKQQPDLIMKNATNVCFVIIYVALRVCVCATKWLEYMRVCYSATITCVSHILFEQTQTHIHSIIIRSSVEFAHIGLRIYWYMQANVRSISSIFWCLLLLIIFS